MFKKLFFLFVLLALAVSACGPTPSDVCGEGKVDHTEGDNVYCKTDAVAESVPTQVSVPTAASSATPSLEAPANTLVINVDGEDVTLTADASGAYFYATTIDGKPHNISFTAPFGYSWAMDADDALGVARHDALDDVLFFGDKAGEYDIWGVYAAGLRISPTGVAPDLAGPALKDRARAASAYQCPRPVFYMEPQSDTVTDVTATVNPFAGICQ